MTEHVAGYTNLSTAHKVVVNAALALVYFIFGKLGLALALPPGYVSALWPAAGVAFAAALIWRGSIVWPGIFIGSLLTNATMSGNLNINGIAIGIAAGSALQAVVGAQWLRRSNPALVLDSPAQVLRFSLLGILACLTAALIGNLTLLVYGVISLAQVPQSFVTWWLGDAFGVQIFTPLALLILIPSPAWKSRRIPVGLPLLLAFSLCGMIYFFVSQAEERQLIRDFSSKTSALRSELAVLDRMHGTALLQLAAQYQVNERNPDSEFIRLTAQISSRLPAFSAISWSPVVDHLDNAKFAVLARQAGVHGAVLRYPPGFSPASDGRGAPVLLIQPSQGNEKAIGVDLMGEPTRREAVDAAVTSGKLTVSRVIRLAQDADGPGGVLLMAPVLTAGVKGVVVGVINLRLIEKELNQWSGIVWELSEEQPAGQTRVAGNSSAQLPVFAGETMLDRVGVYQQQVIQLADRQWRLVLHMPHRVLAADSSYASLLVLCLALFSCGVFANFALIMSGDRERIGREVALKTQALQDEVAERRRYEAELEKARDAAQAANVAKSQFLAAMSHEIRTPMNGILGMAQLLMIDGIDEPERKDCVRTILGSGQTLMTILNDILDLSKVEAGKLELQAVAFDPVALVNETIALFRETATSKGLVLRTESTVSDLRVVGDPVRLRQMLSNLMGNAIKFSDQGEIILGLTQRSVADATLVLEFSVRDQGIGIPADKLGQLFQPFSQVDSSATRRFGGTGLGLSIVRRLAQLMGGDVGVESQEGVGSRFWFHVCLAITEAGINSRRGERAVLDHRLVDVAIAPSQSGQTGRPTMLGHWILVAEDIDTNRKVITSLLGKLGMAVRCVNNGQEALDLLAAHHNDPPRVILMDCQMPVMDGYAATQAIRERERTDDGRHVHIIALTADAFTEDRARCAAVGMDDFLAKPLVLDELASALRRAGVLPPA